MARKGAQRENQVDLASGAELYRLPWACTTHSAELRLSKVSRTFPLRERSGGKVDTEDARKGRVVSQAGESSSRASLQLELRVPDTQMLTIFRDAFLRWLTHRTGPFGRAIGFGDRLSVDEVAPTSDVHGMSTLRLTVSWSPSKSATLARVNSLRTLGGFRTALPHQTSPESFVFVQYPPLADAPLHPELPDDEAGEPVLEPYPRLSRRRRGSRIGTNAARGFATAMTDVQGWARESLRRLGVDLLTPRVPTLATHPRVWTLGLLTSAVVATGFVVGSMYLRSPNRPSVAAAPPASQAEATTGAPALPTVAETVPAPVAAAVDVPPTANPTLVASADPEPQAARPRPQPVERRASTSDRSRKPTRKETALAGRSLIAEAAPASRSADHRCGRSRPGRRRRVSSDGWASDQGHSARGVGSAGRRGFDQRRRPGPYAAGDSRSRCG